MASGGLVLFYVMRERNSIEREPGGVGPIVALSLMLTVALGAVVYFATVPNGSKRRQDAVRPDCADQRQHP